MGSMSLGLSAGVSETKGQSFNGSAMSMLSKTLLMILLSAGIPYVVAGQNTTEVYEVTGAGSFQNQRAEITGQYSYAPYNALGDGKVQFVGTLRSPLGQAELGYEGYTNVTPYDGYLNVQSGPYQGNTYRVGILDNTGGQFVIYDGRPTLGAPNELGRFVCEWRRVR